MLKSKAEAVAPPPPVANQPLPPASPTVTTAAPPPPPQVVLPPTSVVVPPAAGAVPDSPPQPLPAEAKIEKKICLNDLFITQDDEAKAYKAQVLASIPSDIRDVVPLIMQFLQYRFEKGVSLDVLDTVSKWYEAEIKDVKDDKLFVHYKGWPETWDEWIEKKSFTRFAPVNLHSTRGFVSRQANQDPAIDEPEKNRRVALLVSFGFQLEAVTAALTRFHWNVEQAASSLLAF